MKKFFFCVSLVCSGVLTSCVDKNELVDADSKPEWLGGSIYQELKNPRFFEGTFSTYLDLANDLGYTETLDRTGSVTVFPANDEAFDRFFATTNWKKGDGSYVRSYKDLSLAQKKLLFYSSMLDNALLTSMFSNVSNSSGDAVTRGMAMKHAAKLSLIDTVQYIQREADMPQFNPFWDKFRENGKIHIVSDASRSMIVHFTREHMLNNNISTVGSESDFAIITGTPYEEGMAYMFDDQIINGDVTCQNGYIHQMKDVIVPPGNMAQVLKADEETQFVSRILDYYAAPYENQSVTDSYNAWAKENGQPEVDMIYEVRYLNNQPGHRNAQDPDKNPVTELLAYDPGWNEYYPDANATGGVRRTLADVGAMFVPTDDAMVDFFCEGGRGAYLIGIYGNKDVPNDRAHLNENLDSLRKRRPDILTKFINNLMSSSFIQTVPSKFSTILSDASEYKGISLDSMHQREDGRYDIKIANNGVIYKMNTMYSPDEFQSVMAPSSTYEDMQVMNWAVQDPTDPSKNGGTYLGTSFHYYLMAMRANYGFFVPDDEAFNDYYVDPIYLGHAEPRVLKFSYDASRNMPIRCVAYTYDKETGEIGSVMNNGANVDISQWRTLMNDILNYHTVVLEDGETLGDRKYYQTKHGGTVYLPDGINPGAKVYSGQQIDNGVKPAEIAEVFNEKNGKTFRIKHLIESPRNSVSKTLQDNSDRFSSFYRMCAGFSNSALLKWAGIDDQPIATGMGSPQDAYIIFTNTNKNAGTGVSENCLDENVKMFNTFNYTLYAPNNAAIKKATDAGLPTWDEIQNIMRQATMDQLQDQALQNAKDQAKAKIDLLRNFVRYHFQSNAVYADTKVKTGRFNSLSNNELGVAIELRVSGGDDKLAVVDATGKEHIIDAGNTQYKSNLMTRDYWFNSNKESASEIYTSSFCVIHEIDTPLNPGNIGVTW